MIRDGEVALAICGGTDSAVSPLAAESCRQAGLFDTRPEPEGGESRSFFLGEGAGMLIVEEMDAAIRREARIYGEIVSYSCLQSGTARSGGCNLVETMKDALGQAGWMASEVEAVCPAAVYAQSHWQQEQAAIKQLLPTVPTILEYKHRAGHSLAASGAIDLALLLGSLQATGRRAKVLLNSVAFTGQAATLCVDVRNTRAEGCL